MKDLLQYSSTFGPPKINLQDAEILDGYGCTDYAKLDINHQIPTDVTDEEMDYYSYSVFSFMNLEDIIFYTYYIFKRFIKEGEWLHMDFLLYNYERNMEKLESLLNKEQKEIFIKSSLQLFNLHGFDAAWDQCPKLSKFIGIDIEEETVDQWYENRNNLTKKSN